jgi:DNA-binding transcriptional LysR family regulator
VDAGVLRPKVRLACVEPRGTAQFVAGAPIIQEEPMVNRLERSLPIWFSLLKAVEEGSINRAARALNITQPALTRNIARLEQEVGAPLLERSAKGVALTPYGAALVAHARTIAGELRATVDEIDALKGNRSGLVRLGATSVVLGQFVPPALDTLRRDQPEVSVRIIEAGRDQLLSQLRRGELDLVVATMPDKEVVDDLNIQRLFSFELSVIARAEHPIFQQREISFADLARFQWVLPPADTAFYQRVSRAFGRAGIPFPGASVETGSPQASKELVSASDLLAIVPKQSMRSEPASRLREISGKWGFERRNVGVYLRQTSQMSPIVLKLIEALRTTFSWPKQKLAG